MPLRSAYALLAAALCAGWPPPCGRWCSRRARACRRRGGVHRLRRAPEDAAAPCAASVARCATQARTRCWPGSWCCTRSMPAVRAGPSPPRSCSWGPTRHPVPQARAGRGAHGRPAAVGRARGPGVMAERPLDGRHGARAVRRDGGAARARRVVAVGGGLFAIAVAYSVVLLGWHMPSDALGGFAIAGAARAWRSRPWGPPRPGGRPERGGAPRAGRCTGSPAPGRSRPWARRRAAVTLARRRRAAGPAQQVAFLAIAAAIVALALALAAGVARAPA